MDRDEWSGMTSLDRIIGKSSEWRREGFGEISEAWTRRSDCSSCTTVPVPLRIVECRDSLGSLGTCHRHRPRRYLCLTIGWGSPPPHHPKRNARTLLTSIESAPDIFYEERRESELDEIVLHIVLNATIINIDITTERPPSSCEVIVHLSPRYSALSQTDLRQHSLQPTSLSDRTMRSPQLVWGLATAVGAYAQSSTTAAVPTGTSIAGNYTGPLRPQVHFSPPKVSRAREVGSCTRSPPDECELTRLM
jgi:hypothetical protein